MNNTQDMRKFMDIINENNDPVSDLELEEDTEEIEEENEEENEEELQEDEHTKNTPGSSLINVKGEEVPNSVVMSVHHDGKVHGYAYRERGHITLVKNDADTGETTRMILSQDSYRILCDWIRGGE